MDTPERYDVSYELNDGTTYGRRFEREEKLSPSRDPNMPHPDMVFTGGHWMSADAAQRRLLRQRERNRERYRDHSDEMREYQRLWREANREKIRDHDSLRVKIGGRSFRVPDLDFKQFAISLREERKRHQTEGNQNG